MLHDLTALLGDPVTEPEEEAFVVFSQSIPSQSLGFIDAQAAEVDITVGGRDITIRQSRGLLTSNRKEGTTGAVLWKVTPHLASWLTSPTFLSDLSILTPSSTALELGAGISGVVASLLAPQIALYIATDQDYVLKLLKQNIAENLPSSSSATSRSGGSGSGSGGNNKKPRAKKKLAPSAESKSTPRVETLELDWERDSVSWLPAHVGLSEGQGLDLLIACDCIYNESLIEPLNSTCAQLCKLRDATAEKPTVCLVAQQLRSHDVFEAWLRSFHRLFHVWQVPDGLLDEALREGSGFIVHVGVVR